MERRGKASGAALFALSLVFGSTPALAQDSYLPRGAGPWQTSGEGGSAGVGAHPLDLTPPKRRTTTPPPQNRKSDLGAMVWQPLPKKPEPSKPKAEDVSAARELQKAEPASVEVKASPAPQQNATAAPSPFCRNITDAALDARFLSQRAEIERLEHELERRVSDLEKKRAEFQDWLARREVFIAKATDELVALYSKVKPEAAAAQLGALDEETAAAIVMKLKPRTSSAILNEMAPAKAARLLSVVVGAARKDEPGQEGRAEEASGEPKPPEGALSDTKGAAKGAPESDRKS